MLDVAEPSLARANGAVTRRLRELGEAGVLIAVDGFTMSSPTDRLAELGVGALKVDPSYLSAMADSREAIGSLHRLLALCRELNIETFAEGIEHGWQLASLQKERCRFGQGSYFSHPIAPEALEAILSLEPLFS